MTHPQAKEAIDMSKPGIGQLVAGAGGVLLIVSLFMPWAEVSGTDRSGWEFSTTTDVFLLIAALMAIATTLTGGRITLFRPDMTVNAAADLLGVVATVLLAYLLLFDLPSEATAQTGLYLSLASAIAIMSGAGDYSVLRRSSSDPASDSYGLPQ
jgi:hypothetical protein